LSRFEYAERVTTAAAPEEALEAARRALARQGANVLRLDAGQVQGQVGSQILTRLLGGWVAAGRHLPVRVSVSAEQSADTTLVSVTAAEAVRVGSLIGMEAKLRGRCQQVALVVAEDMGELRQSGHDARRPL